MRNLSTGEKQEIFDSFKQANYWWILLTIVLGILSHTSRTLRWSMLLKPMGYNPKFKNVFLAVLISYFANLALPRLGEISRCGILARYEKIPFQKSFGTVVAERAFDLITFVFLFFLNLALQFNKVHGYIDQKVYTPISEKFSGLSLSGYLLYTLIGLVIVVIVLLIYLRKNFSHKRFYQKIKNVILGFLEGLKSLLKVKRPGLFLLHTVIIWFLYFIMTYIVFQCLPETASLSLGAGFAVFIFATIGIMIVQGGIGIYPAIVAETLFIYNIAETKGYAMGWLLWSGQTLMIIIAGIISLIILPLINKSKNVEA
jgi:uncharacterized protein (TIRG00374 family)